MREENDGNGGAAAPGTSRAPVGLVAVALAAAALALAGLMGWNAYELSHGAWNPLAVAGCAAENAETVQELPVEAFTDVDAVLEAADVSISAADGYGVRVIRTERPEVRFGIRDGWPAVTVAHEDYPSVHVGVAGGRLRIHEPPGAWSDGGWSCRVEVTVPAGAALGDVKLGAKSGSIAVSGIADLRQAAISASSETGEVEVGGVQRGSGYEQAGPGAMIYAKTGSGDIYIS